MKMIKNILGFFRKKESISYPHHFMIIKFSDMAFENGTKDDSNKIIERYYRDGYGNLEIKKYRYSKERVDSLRECFQIPVYDKTSEGLTFPIVGKIKFGVVKFISK